MIETLKGLLQESIDRAYQFDKKTIEKGGMEQACVFRISHYLQCFISNTSVLEDYVVDCEYNKNGDGIKKKL
ncbi:MAG: hypothetical protein EKK64_08515 [Neisseriaceae bacterium]|nr:MAG: hypothetical protein EKK64_08515 [Neisseriaceae bacterium]